MAGILSIKYTGTVTLHYSVRTDKRRDTDTEFYHMEYLSGVSYLVPVSLLEMGTHRVKSSCSAGQQVVTVILLHQLDIVGTLRLERWGGEKRWSFKARERFHHFS